MLRMAITFLFAGLALASAPSAAEMLVGEAKPAELRARVLELVNHARLRGRKCGRERFAPTTPLAASPLLDAAAQDHATDMARHGYFEHTGRDGSAPKDRLARRGYLSRLTGENIAYGPESAEEVVAGWLASPGHCANIMEPRIEEMGIAFAIEERRGAIYWVQTLAMP